MNFALPSRILAILAVLMATACSAGEPPSATPETPDGESPDVGPEDVVTLTVREGPRRQTTGDVPHIQIDAMTDPAADDELRRRAFLLPGVEDRESNRSLPGARGLALSSDLELARPDVISGSPEFAHIHPDGSMHVWLPVSLANEVNEKKWGELHPWVDQDGFWDGVVMVYAPESPEDTDVAIEILVNAYNFVTGASIEPTDIP